MSFVGRAFLLQLDLGGGEYQTLAAQLTTSFSISNQQIEVTDKDGSRWRKLLEGGEREMELGGQGFINDSDSYELLREYAASGEIANYRVTFASGQTLDAALQVMSLDGDGSFDSAEQYSLALVSADSVAVDGGGPPPSPDPEFSKVSFLLPGTGPNGSNTFVDMSPVANVVNITRGAPVVNTSVSPFGDGLGSIYFDGSSGLYLEDNAALDLRGVSSWTLEAQVRSAGAGGYQTIMGKRQIGFGCQYEIGLDTGSTNLFFYKEEGLTTTATAISTTQFDHVAYTWSGTALLIHRNGVLTNTFTGVNVGAFEGGHFVIGQLFFHPSNLESFVGYLAEMRLTLEARYAAADFTPPTARFPTS